MIKKIQRNNNSLHEITENLIMSEQNRTVYIVDDEKEICDSLRLLFESAELNVKTWLDPLEFLNDLDPAVQQGCLIADVMNPAMSGLLLLEKLKKMQCPIPVIMITGYGDIQMAVTAMKIGAAEFFTKPVCNEHLLEVVKNYLNNPLINNSSISSDLSMLTKREQQVINLILSGKFNKEIADELNISNSTVEAHRARIMKKFDVKNVVQLIRKYYKIDNTMAMNSKEL